MLQDAVVRGDDDARYGMVWVCVHAIMQGEDARREVKGIMQYKTHVGC